MTIDPNAKKQIDIVIAEIERRLEQEYKDAAFNSGVRQYGLKRAINIISEIKAEINE